MKLINYLILIALSAFTQKLFTQIDDQQVFHISEGVPLISRSHSDAAEIQSRPVRAHKPSHVSQPVITIKNQEGHNIIIAQ